LPITAAKSIIRRRKEVSVIRIDHVATIPQPPDVVFPVISDPETQLIWDAATLRSVTKLDDGELARGSRYRGNFKGFGTVEYEFVDYQPVTRFAHLAKIPLGRMRHTTTLEPDGEGTRIIQVGELEPNLVSRLMGGMFRRNIRKRFATIVDEVSSYLSGQF
jgi:polyketide cyclase/dehydrase/lipid transport protein